MALSSPYDTIVDMVKTEIGAFLLPDEEQEFIDDQWIAQVNAAVRLIIYQDLGSKYKITGNILDPAILDDPQWMACVVYATAERILSNRLQDATTQNIAIDKGDTKISTRDLVNGLRNSMGIVHEKYNGALIRACEGIVQIPSE